MSAELPRAVTTPSKAFCYEYVMCLACGAKRLTLARHIRAAHAVSIEQYRAHYGLEPDCPLIARAYSNRLRLLAAKHPIGLRQGRKHSRNLHDGAPSMRARQ
ncbi:MucR family transcriptional regulator [Parafrankia sp. BMG5.11]|uniref:MucR family transcriptional regulator n=1 Tax=Parafrankia sp. BMG5.11 TaxID=222540 RepID=UPI00103D0BF3|nr:hypothetical protein E0504_11310 [Parafrankia sp. BMG5.11]